MDSTKNCATISLLRAPIAFLIQISLVLSVTETIIIFITPIPPTKSEISPTTSKKFDIALEVLLTLWENSAKLCTENPALASLGRLNFLSKT